MEYRNLTTLLALDNSPKLMQIALDGSTIFRIIIAEDEKGKGSIALGSDRFSVIGINQSEGKAQISYHTDVDQLGSITAELSLSCNGIEVTGTLSITSSGSFFVRQVQFPYIEDYHVNTFDNLMMSTPWGDSIPRPAMTIRQYCAGKPKLWIYDYVKCGEDEVSYSYPSIMAMQYIALYNSANTLYIASYSTGSDTMTFNAKALGKTALGLSINHFPFLKNGSWQSPLCGIAALNGDWHGASDLYAGHMRGVFATPDTPPWMRDEAEGWHGWMSLVMHRESRPPIYRYNDLPGLYEKARELGLNTLHIGGWENNGCDTGYPDYDIDGQLGTKEELRSALDQIRAMGGHAILYTNGRVVDPASRFYQSGGSSCVCVDEEGRPYTECYDSTSVFRIACPSCGQYREYLGGQVRRIIGEYGAHALQIDQISCNHAYFCYNQSHLHSTPANNFLPGVEQELIHLRSIYKVLDPQAFVWCEGCHERFGQQYDVEQGHGEEFTWQIGESIPEQFKYTFPDRIVTGISNSLQQLCHTHCQGKPFDFFLETVAEPGFMELVKHFIAVRRAFPKYFLNGIFTDNKGLEASPGIRAFGIESRDRAGLLVNLWLPGVEPDAFCSATLKNPRDTTAIKIAYPSDACIGINGNHIDVRWKGPVSTLIFE